MATESSVAGLALARACFAVRIVNIDSHMAPALHKDAHSGAVTSAYGPDHPVIRIFGATPAGQKCCVHVHGVYPYFYIHLEDAKSVLKNPGDYVASLRNGLEEALRVVGSELSANDGAGAAAAAAASSSNAEHSSPSRPQPSSTGPSSSSGQLQQRNAPIAMAKRAAVHSVQLVRGIPFYGFHHAGQEGDASIGAPDRGTGHVFAKITLYNPGMIKRASEALQRGAVLGTTFLPYEAHLPYLLQFFIDYNLAGMALLAARDVRFRLPLPSSPPKPHISERSLRARGGLTSAQLGLAYEHEAASVAAADGSAAHDAKQRDGGATQQRRLHSQASPSSSSSSLPVLSRLWLASNTPPNLCHPAPQPQPQPPAADGSTRNGQHIDRTSVDAMSAAILAAVGGTAASAAITTTGGASSVAQFMPHIKGQLIAPKPSPGAPIMAPVPSNSSSSTTSAVAVPTATLAGGAFGGVASKPSLPAAPPAAAAPKAPPAQQPLQQPQERPPPPWFGLERYGVLRPADRHGIGRVKQPYGYGAAAAASSSSSGGGSSVPVVVSRVSTCALEADVWACDILNPLIRDAMRAKSAAAAAAARAARKAGREPPPVSPEVAFSSVLSLAALWEEERQRRLAGGMAPSQAAMLGEHMNLSTTQGNVSITQGNVSGELDKSGTPAPSQQAVVGAKDGGSAVPAAAASAADAGASAASSPAKHPQAGTSAVDVSGDGMRSTQDVLAEFDLDAQYEGKLARLAAADRAAVAKDQSDPRAVAALASLRSAIAALPSAAECLARPSLQDPPTTSSSRATPPTRHQAAVPSANPAAPRGLGTAASVAAAAAVLRGASEPVSSPTAARVLPASPPSFVSPSSSADAELLDGLFQGPNGTTLLPPTPADTSLTSLSGSQAAPSLGAFNATSAVPSASFGLHPHAASVGAIAHEAADVSMADAPTQPVQVSEDDDAPGSGASAAAAQPTSAASSRRSSVDSSGSRDGISSGSSVSSVSSRSSSPSAVVQQQVASSSPQQRAHAVDLGGDSLFTPELKAAETAAATVAHSGSLLSVLQLSQRQQSTSFIGSSQAPASRKRAMGPASASQLQRAPSSASQRLPPQQPVHSASSQWQLPLPSQASGVGIRASSAVVRRSSSKREWDDIASSQYVERKVQDEGGADVMNQSALSANQQDEIAEWLNRSERARRTLPTPFRQQLQQRGSSSSALSHSSSAAPRNQSAAAAGASVLQNSQVLTPQPSFADASVRHDLDALPQLGPPASLSSATIAAAIAAHAPLPPPQSPLHDSLARPSPARAAGTPDSSSRARLDGLRVDIASPTNTSGRRRRGSTSAPPSPICISITPPSSQEYNVQNKKSGGRHAEAANAAVTTSARLTLVPSSSAAKGPTTTSATGTPSSSRRSAVPQPTPIASSSQPGHGPALLIYNTVTGAILSSAHTTTPARAPAKTAASSSSRPRSCDDGSGSRRRKGRSPQLSLRPPKLPSPIAPAGDVVAADDDVIEEYEDDSEAVASLFPQPRTSLSEQQYVMALYDAPASANASQALSTRPASQGDQPHSQASASPTLVHVSAAAALPMAAVTSLPLQNGAEVTSEMIDTSLRPSAAEGPSPDASIHQNEAATPPLLSQEENAAPGIGAAMEVEADDGGDRLLDHDGHGTPSQVVVDIKHDDTIAAVRSPPASIIIIGPSQPVNAGGLARASSAAGHSISAPSSSAGKPSSGPLMPLAHLDVSRISILSSSSSSSPVPPDITVVCGGSTGGSHADASVTALHMSPALDAVKAAISPRVMDVVLPNAPGPPVSENDAAQPRSPSFLYRLAGPMPSASQLVSSLPSYGLPEVVHPVPHYSNDDDVPPAPRTFAGLQFRVPGSGVDFLRPFDTSRSVALQRWMERRKQVAEASANSAGANTAGFGGVGVAATEGFSNLPGRVFRTNVSSNRNTASGSKRKRWATATAPASNAAAAAAARMGGADGVDDDEDEDEGVTDDDLGLGFKPPAAAASAASSATAAGTGPLLPYSQDGASQGVELLLSQTDYQRPTATTDVSAPFRRFEQYANRARSGHTSSSAIAGTPPAFITELISSSSSSSTSAAFAGGGGAASDVEQSLPIQRFRTGQGVGYDSLTLHQRRRCWEAGHVQEHPVLGLRLSCTRHLVRYSASFPTFRDVQKWLLRHPPAGAPSEKSTNGASSAVPPKTKPAFDANTGAMLPAAVAAAPTLAVVRAATALDEPTTMSSILQRVPSTSFAATPAATDVTLNTTPGTSTPDVMAADRRHGVTSQLSPASAVAAAAAKAAAAASGAPPSGVGVTFKRPAPDSKPVSKKAKLASAKPAAPASDAPPPSAGASAATPSSSSSSSSSSASSGPLNVDLNQHLTLMSVEVATRTRGALLPDPRYDSVVGITYAIADDDVIWAHRRAATAEGGEFDFARALIVGTIVVDEDTAAAVSKSSSVPPASTSANATVVAPSAPPNVRFNSDGRPVIATGQPHLPSGGDDDGSSSSNGTSLPYDYDAPPASRVGGGMGLGRRVILTHVADEAALLWAFAALVRDWDPDVIAGYEMQRESLGYLLDRAAVLGIPLTSQLSRVPTAGPDRRQGNDEYGEKHDSGIWLSGRVTLNTWRILKGELKLGIYTFANVVYNVLRVRVPHYAHHVLTAWWDGPPPKSSSAAASASAAVPPARGLTRWRVVEHLLSRCALTLHVLDALDVTGRTSEMARLFGIDFFSVLSRGSQYRVEAVMLRVSKPFGYLAPSPSRSQVARQAAMEIIPLIMEPQSRVYASPVVVFDFQSLYPSIIIGYNMCFSTVLGRLSPDVSRDGWNPKVGFAEYAPPPGAVADCHTAHWEGTAVRRQEIPLGPSPPSPEERPHRPSSAYIAPNGVVFAPWMERRGILPRMLQEILDTRVMVKNAMKGADVRGDPVLTRVMHARQFALKMIANVTYGYTAAGFSGRMPCAEIADAIVDTGRRTLERAIALIESHPAWRARVVYGDTDSMFVALPGRSVAEAFAVGERIAAEVTARNPRPMFLKLEKVYSPCVLVAKKRYAGYMYESPKEIGSPPALDCKGLEMVRRDTCGLVSRLMEGSMRTLFDSRLDLSAVKDYMLRGMRKVLEGRAPVADYVFAKEVRLGTYSDRGPMPPAAIVASKAMVSDPRAEPRYGERVPYVVVYGEPNARLIDLVITPHQLLTSPGAYRLNGGYYLTKQVIPALSRVLSLVGCDLAAWYAEMRKPAMRRGRPLPLTHAAPGIGGVAAFVAPNALVGAGTRELVITSSSNSGSGLFAAEAEHDDGAVSLLTTQDQDEASTGAGAGAGASSSYKPPAIQKNRGASSSASGSGQGHRTIDAYYASRLCHLCGSPSKGALCDGCSADPQRSAFMLLQRHASASEARARTLAVCQSCARLRDASATGAPACDSLDCPLFFVRCKLDEDVAHAVAALGDAGLR